MPAEENKPSVNTDLNFFKETLTLKAIKSIGKSKYNLLCIRIDDLLKVNLSAREEYKEENQERLLP